MLIETPFVVNDVVTLKITSSEEIIGRFVSSTDTSIKIKKPMTFMMGAQGLGLVPFMFSAPKEVDIEIPLSLVICKVKTDDMVAKQYMQQTTGLSL